MRILDGQETHLRNGIMKLPRILLLLLMTASLSPAAEVLESLKTREGREYFKVEVLSNDDVGVRIRHEAGTARIPYNDLPDAVQSKYRAERKNAAVMKIEATKAEHERIRLEEEKKKQEMLEEKARKPTRTKPTEPEAPTKIQPVSDKKREIEKLDDYMAEMKVKAHEAVMEASRLRSLAQAERSKTRTVVKGYSDRGTATQVVPDKSGWAKASRYEEQAFTLERQADTARALILEAKAKRQQLKEDSDMPVGD